MAIKYIVDGLIYEETGARKALVANRILEEITIVGGGQTASVSFELTSGETISNSAVTSSIALFDIVQSYINDSLVVSTTSISSAIQNDYILTNLASSLNTATVGIQNDYTLTDLAVTIANLNSDATVDYSTNGATAATEQVNIAVNSDMGYTTTNVVSAGASYTETTNTDVAIPSGVTAQSAIAQLINAGYQPQSLATTLDSIQTDIQLNFIATGQAITDSTVFVTANVQVASQFSGSSVTSSQMNSGTIENVTDTTQAVTTDQLSEQTNQSTNIVPVAGVNISYAETINHNVIQVDSATTFENMVYSNGHNLTTSAVATIEGVTNVDVSYAFQLDTQAIANAITTNQLQTNFELTSSILAQAATFSGITANKVMDVVVDGFLISGIIITPDYRTFKVSADVRVFKVRKQ